MSSSGSKEHLIPRVNGVDFPGTPADAVVEVRPKAWRSWTDSGKVYMPVAADHKNQNLKLMPFIEKKVKVTGTTVEKGGVNGIAIKTVEAAP